MAGLRRAVLAIAVGTSLFCSWTLGAAVVAEDSGLKCTITSRCQLFDNKTQKKWNCQYIWNTFNDSIPAVSDDVCDLPSDQYSEYIRQTQQTIPKDKTLLWSGKDVLGTMIKNYTESCHVINLEYTFTGCLLDDLKWCNQAGELEKCDDCKVFSKSSVGAFWNQASLEFAGEASGLVSILLSGKRKGGALSKQVSWRALNYRICELHMLQKLQLLLLDKTETEQCGKGTVKTLQQKLKEYGFEENCEDNVNEIYGRLCEERRREGDIPGFYHCSSANLERASFFGIFLVMLYTYINNFCNQKI
ncbi:ADP-ribosyl cyclase/cyclic ADP-ribose hydrolase 2-like [Ptychodera flava]|uniref:ADP-ribosyl cyclase/cyclic ADP-ribose hydrolase 2-like n=1 Tax=Ptychodera flava TaxID=63121 RepID=UPI00396A51C4